VTAVCREAARGAVVEPANFNSPGQVVIAGDAAAVQRAIEAAKIRGAKRAITLPVSVPAHSSLMRPAGERLRERLRTLAVRAPAIRYVSAVDARAHEEPADIRELLVRQISSPVRWTQTLSALSAGGIAQVIECGPGRVLTGLNRRIERRPDLTFLALEDPATIDTALSATAGAGHA
jgi:[acyl-carrier-protein] S-malonyltransferase